MAALFALLFLLGNNHHHYQGGLVVTAFAPCPRLVRPSLSLSSSSTSSWSSPSTKSPSSPTVHTWQDDLEEFLDPTTSLARRQIVLSRLVQSSAEIQQAVQTALRERQVGSLVYFFVVVVFLECEQKN
jgi:hypothetical protein